jgi:hypothetical protein
LGLDESGPWNNNWGSVTSYISVLVIDCSFLHLE